MPRRVRLRRAHRHQAQGEQPRLELDDRRVTSAREVGVASGASGAAERRARDGRREQPRDDGDPHLQPRRPLSMARRSRSRSSPWMAATFLPSVP